MRKIQQEAIYLLFRGMKVCKSHRKAQKQLPLERGNWGLKVYMEIPFSLMSVSWKMA